jgi:hypothetical protein
MEIKQVIARFEVESQAQAMITEQGGNYANECSAVMPEYDSRLRSEEARIH